MFACRSSDRSLIPDWDRLKYFHSTTQVSCIEAQVVISLVSNVVVFVGCVCVNVPLTAKVIWRQGHGLKSHLTDW